jgi:hypothetical protein
MPTERSARRVLVLIMGIAAIFDLTGTAIYRAFRPVLPPSPPPQEEDDPLRAAMSTIMSAHQDAMRAHTKSGGTLPR